MDQYVIEKFVESFEMILGTLVENAGLNVIEIVSSLYAKHAHGNAKVGISLDEDICKDVLMMSLNLWDLQVTQ